MNIPIFTAPVIKACETRTVAHATNIDHFRPYASATLENDQ